MKHITSKISLLVAASLITFDTQTMARKLFFFPCAGVAAVLAAQGTINAYKQNKKFVDACEDTPSSLSFQEQRAIREIFRSHGVDSVHITDAEAVQEKLGKGFPSLGTLKAFALPGKNILIVPGPERHLLENGRLVLTNSSTGRTLAQFEREGTQAGLHHEATHCKHVDGLEVIGHNAVASTPFSLLVGQAAYVKAGGALRLPALAAGLVAAASIKFGMPYINAYRRRCIEKRCDLAIPTSKLARAKAVDLYNEAALLRSFGHHGNDSKDLLNDHPATDVRVKYLLEHAQKLEAQGK